jgi:hypothetical protein
MAAQDYYGYIPPTERLDLGKLATDLSKTISGIGERRELEKEQLDQIQADNTRIINDADIGKSQTFQTMALNGTQKGVQFINQLNKQLKAGQLSPKEYKQKMNTVMESWGTFANTVKTYDSRMAEIQKQQQDGKASGVGVSANEFFAQSSELKDKDIFIDDNGNMSMGRIDPNTGQLDPDSVQSFRSMALPSNMVFDKVPLDETVNDVIKLWKPYIEENNLNTIESVKSNPDLARKMADLTGSLTSNPRLTASLLVDNTGDGYDVYFNQADYNNKIGEMIQTENEVRRISGKGPMNQAEQNEFAKESSGKLIEMRKDATDTYQPVITEDQLNRAKEAIEVAVSLQLGFKSTQETPPRQSSGGGGGGGGGRATKDTSSQTVDNIRKLIISGKPEDYEALSEFSKDMQYSFKQGAPGKLKVFKKESNGRTTEIGEVSFANAGKYFGFDNLDKWNEFVADSKKRISGSGGNNMTPEQWNNKWATLKKGQKMVGLDGKTYTKQ